MSKMKLSISSTIFPISRWTWEITDGKIYICAYQDDGYANKQNAKRAAMNAARKLGIEIESIEYGD